MRSVERYPVTIAVATLTLVVGVVGLLSQDVVTALRQDPQRIGDGEWWRLVTPMLVQGAGLGQLAFNLLGGVVVGVAVERWYRRGRWLAVYLAGGLVGIAVTSLLRPHDIDSGSSGAVAGMIGAVVVGIVRSGRMPAWPAFVYAVFFETYLCGLAVAGPVAGSIAGTVCAAVTGTTAMHASEWALRGVVVGLVAVPAVVLVARGDVHGIGVLAGALVALLPGGRRSKRV